MSRHHLSENLLVVHNNDNSVKYSSDLINVSLNLKGWKNISQRVSCCQFLLILLLHLPLEYYSTNCSSVWNDSQQINNDPGFDSLLGLGVTTRVLICTRFYSDLLKPFLSFESQNMLNYKLIYLKKIFQQIRQQ